MPLVEAVLWRVSKLATSTLTRLVIYLRSSRFDNRRLSVNEQFDCSLIQFVVWSGQSIQPAPILLYYFVEQLDCSLFFLFLLLLSIVSDSRRFDRINQYNVGNDI